MMSWLKSVGRAVLLGVAWGLAWAPVALVVGLIIDPNESMDEMWPVVGAYPGFLCAVVFCAIVGITHRRCTFRELHLPRAGALGALSGLLIATLPFALSTPNPALAWWHWGGIVGSITLMSALSAVATVLVSRCRVNHRIDAGATPAR